MTAAQIEADIDALAASDPRLRQALEVTGPIRVHLREPGMGTLIHLILEQQISIDAARAMFRRLTNLLGGSVTAHGLLTLDDETMRSCGFTAQKAQYARGIAHAVVGGALDLESLAALDAEAVTEALTSLRGIGPWTAANYRLWALGDRDVFPTGDLALAIGWQEISNAPERPTYPQLDAIAQRWRPLRTAAAMIVWHRYLAVRNRN